MDQLQKQVARAARRLVLEQFLGRLVWCLLGALTIAAAAIAVPRVFVLSNLPANWDMAWLAGALGAGLLLALGWTLIRHRNAMDAAIEIDRRFDLRERVASSLSLRPEEQSSEAGRAVVNDAVRAVKRIEVDEKFPVKLDRRAWWPLVPAAIAFALVTFVDNREAASSLDPNSAASAQKQVKQSAEAVRKKIEEQRKKAEEQGLKDAEGLFKKIEQGTRDLAEKQTADRTKATVKMNDLIKQLEQRREQIGGKDSLKQQFQNMKNLGAGPAEKAANAMKQGDWNKAMQEIKELEKQLRDGKLDANAKEKLAKQLEQMKEKLEAAAQARQQAMEDLKKQIEQARRAGNLSKAGELQEKLDRMQKQEQQMNRLQQLAQQMGQIQKQLQQGDDQKAAAAMAKMAEQLGQMQQQMKELEMLDAAMDQLEMAKDALACEECDGEGCEACMGSMANMEKFGANSQSQMNNGMGGDPRAGAGPRPDERNATNTRDTRVRQDPKQGPATFAGMVEGPNVTGDVAQQIKEEMATLEAEPADPLTSERLPSSRREHAEEYFRILREGK
jgi:hypothetical protein